MIGAMPFDFDAGVPSPPFCMQPGLSRVAPDRGTAVHPREPSGRNG